MKSGKSGDLDGFQQPRRSGRPRKPRADDNYVPFSESPPKTRGKYAAGRNLTKATGSNQKNQVKWSREMTRHQSSSESDEDCVYDSDEYENSDTIDNLEDKVDDLAAATRRDMAELDFFIKLLFSAMPNEIKVKLRAYARRSDNRSSIEEFLNDSIDLNSVNSLNNGVTPRSANVGTGGTVAATEPRPVARPGPSTAAAASGAAVAVAPSSAAAAPSGVTAAAAAGPVAMTTPTTPEQPEQQQPQVFNRDNTRNATVNNRINNSREQEQIEKRKRNIVIKGLAEDLRDGDKGAVHRMLDTLGLDFLKGRDCWAKRIGRGDSDRPRLLVVTFENEWCVEEILKDKLKLSWTDDRSEHGNFSSVYIDPDLTWEERQILFDKRKEDRLYRQNGGGGGHGSLNGNRQNREGNNDGHSSGNNRNNDENRQNNDGSNNDQSAGSSTEGNANTTEGNVGSPALTEGSLDQLISNAREAENQANNQTRETGITNDNSDTTNNTDAAAVLGDGNIITGSTDGTTENIEELENTGSQIRATEQPSTSRGLGGTPRRLFNMAMNKVKSVRSAGQGNETGTGATSED